MVATPPTTTSRSWAGWWAVAPRARAADVGLWLLACAPVVGRPVAEGATHPWVDVVAAVLALGLIATRRVRPLVSLAVGLVAMLAATAIAGHPTALMGTSIVLLFGAAVRSDRPTAVRVGIAGTAAILATVAILYARHFLGPELLAGIAWPVLAVAGGDAVRSRREAIAAAEERAARAEATREEEARRRVVEERIHIARELHDVVAHHIAVVNVQAGVAAHLLRTKPDDAAAALATVRTAAGQVLEELAGILGVLRDAGETEAPTAPAPTLDDVPALVASFDRAGLRVVLETAGRSQPVGGATAIAVYRTVQEALTNAHKHGDGTALVRLRHGDDELEVTVRNPVGADRTAAVSGFGLLGMRERVHAAAGSLTAGPRPDGTFVVEATFPYQRAPEAT